jgi:hypothetical protein
VGALMMTLNASLPSASVSSRIGTVKLAVICWSAKSSVPVTGV